uniref:Uncharacterized protein n=1 Tax=Nelumbo nucifera TaxID=4432 RepID=A0A822ZP83_NELNU|nr:TPA_asm: hypothetical protein HUJ06_017731 [Nelumbo nucifera]
MNMSTSSSIIENLSLTQFLNDSDIMKGYVSLSFRSFCFMF